MEQPISEKLEISLSNEELGCEFPMTVEDTHPSRASDNRKAKLIPEKLEISISKEELGMSQD